MAPTGSGLKTDPGEDQVGPSTLTRVVGKCAVGTYWLRAWASRVHAGSVKKLKNGPHRVRPEN